MINDWQIAAGIGHNWGTRSRIWQNILRERAQIPEYGFCSIREGEVAVRFGGFMSIVT